MNVMLVLSPEQWALIRDAAHKAGKDPADLLYRALELGWPALRREIDGVPRPPRLQLVK